MIDDEVDENLEKLAFLLSIMMKQINPGINQLAAMDLLIDFMDQDMSESSAVAFGILISSSADEMSEELH